MPSPPPLSPPAYVLGPVGGCGCGGVWWGEWGVWGGGGVVFEKQLGLFTHDVRRKVFIVQKMKCYSRFLLHLVNLSLIVCTVRFSVS